MLKLIFIPFLISYTTSAEVSLNASVLPHEERVINHDVNKDGKIDRIEYYKGDAIVKLEEDKNFSGAISHWTTYTPFKDAETPVEIREIDTNADGKVDRKNFEYHDKKHDLRIITTEVDADFNGSFEKTFTTHDKLNQRKDCVNCTGPGLPTEQNMLLRLAKDSRGAAEELFVGDFQKTSFGYDVQKACLERWGKGFTGLLKEAMNTGFQCLKKLSDGNKKNAVKPDGAGTNLTNLNFLLEKKRVTVACNQKDYKGWEGTAAHASISDADKIESLGIKHPYMSINPSHPKKAGAATKEEAAELKKTLFHEQLHNLGIKHGEGIEISYTCETCCFEIDTEGKSASDIEAAKKQKEVSCKICSGGYAGVSDKKYIEDFMEWGKLAYETDRVSNTINSVQKEFPKNRFALLAFTELNSGFYNPVATKMVQIFKKRFPNLSVEEKEKIEKLDANENEQIKKTPLIDVVSSTVANAHIILLFDHESKKAFEELKASKKHIQEVMKREKTAKTDEERWMYEDIRKNYTRLLENIWLTKHPKKMPESHEAYLVLDELKLL